MKYNLKLLIADIKDYLKIMLRDNPVGICSSYPLWKIKLYMIRNGLALDSARNPSWFYTAYSRGGQDPLTNYTLKRLIDEPEKNKEVLITGCGTGIMLFFLIDKGFTQVDGFDYLPECIEIANYIKEKGNYAKTNLWVDDGFNPQNIKKKYDIITAMHWVFSAWMGNYGNSLENIDPYNPDYREKKLFELLKVYKYYLKSNGVLILEITDSVADYRVSTDHLSNKS